MSLCFYVTSIYQYKGNWQVWGNLTVLVLDQLLQQRKCVEEVLRKISENLQVMTEEVHPASLAVNVQ